MTVLDNKVFLVFDSSSELHEYNSHTYRQQLRSIVKVDGLKEPLDIIGCGHDRQLYVAEARAIWQVPADDHSKYVKSLWLTTQSTTDQFKIAALSPTSSGLLVTSRDPPTLREYNTAVDASLVPGRVVKLPQFVKALLHAVETTHDTFVVCHQGTSQDDSQCAVNVVYNFSLVCRSVCLSDDNFRKSRCRKFIFAHPMCLRV